MKVKERPILFQARGIKGILEGRKTQTRRIIKRDWQGFTRFEWTGAGWNAYLSMTIVGDDIRNYLSCPYGNPGDRLWVRESLKMHPVGVEWLYAADDKHVMVCVDRAPEMAVWAHHKEGEYCASIHMPRFASRLTLAITDVRVQRVQDISDSDIQAEGCRCPSDCAYCSDPDYGHPGHARPRLAELWDNTNGVGAWLRNDWVWAITFKVKEALSDIPPHSTEQ